MMRKGNNHDHAKAQRSTKGSRKGAKEKKTQRNKGSGRLMLLRFSFAPLREIPLRSFASFAPSWLLSVKQRKKNLF
jgi:hypothetical protein